MQIDPVQEWQRLTALYREMGEVELRELAMQYGDLTEQAQHVLRDELKKRGLPDPLARVQRSASSPSNSIREFSESGETDDDASGSAEFTWKAKLRYCDSYDQAWQIYEVLRRAGIESWITRPGSMHAVPFTDIGIGDLLVSVPADQLEEATLIAGQPIPPDIVEESKVKNPDYEAPACPKCGEPDPILQGADPVNTWLCEACGAQWSDPTGDFEPQQPAEEKNGLRSGKSRPATGQLFP
jgi:ribosomal protein L37AE/L43A